jgi:hypothetical protein
MKTFIFFISKPSGALSITYNTIEPFVFTHTIGKIIEENLKI